MIPFLASDEDIQEAKIEWAGDLVDIPVSSKLRVLTGMEFLLLYQIISELEIH